jgi:peptidoglycan hydrolase-like protein with peptidoglycan-binding domain
MSGCPRDLAVTELWSSSLQRSRDRRARAGRSRSARNRPEHDAVVALLAPSARRVRDLAEEEPWQLSLGRSRARRRAAELQFVPASSRAKRISLGALVALTVGPTASIASGQGTSAAASAAGSAGPATTTEHVIELVEGNEGRQVALLQEALGGIKVDGVFGPETEEAVRSFQSSHDLKVDGIVGPQTSAALRGSTSGNALTATIASVTPGQETSTSTGTRSYALDEESNNSEPPDASSGESTASSESTVSSEGTAAGESTSSTETSPQKPSEEAVATDEVQRLQNALHLPVDGIFGPETEAAVRRLQARHGLTVDGIVGPETWGAVGVQGAPTLTPPPSALPAPTPASPTSATATATAASAQQPAPAAQQPQAPAAQGNPVERLQAALHLPVDGEFGPETEAAVRRLQARHGLTVDGVVGPETWSVIGVSGEATLTPPPGVSAAAQASSSTATTDVDDPSAAAGPSAGAEEIVARVIDAGDEIATRPYVWGGGHGSFESEGYDCSGSVSYALHGGGLLSSPEDSTGLESYGEPGPGRYITIYANAEHAFMVVDGKRFDTVALAETGDRWSDTMTSTAGFVARHPAGL